MGIKTRTSYKSTWNNKKTTVIRVPVALKDKIIQIARKLDRKECLSFDSDDNENFIKLMNEFIKTKKSRYGINGSQQGRFNRDTRSWDRFNEFYENIKQKK